MKAFGTQESSQEGRKRSRAWVYYAVLAVVGVGLAFSTHGKSLIATLVLGAYAVYIFCGGKYVYWIW
jgi:predicted lysophospholipase L1 biosynthesis ABC-type transport system permease subunit